MSYETAALPAHVRPETSQPEMISDLSFGVPDCVAVEIFGDDNRISIEPFGMSQQC